MAASAQATARTNRASARLLDLRAIVGEFGGSYWTWRRLLLDGSLPRVTLPGVRRLLCDRRDLERLLEAWKERT